MSLTLHFGVTEMPYAYSFGEGKGTYNVKGKSFKKNPKKRFKSSRLMTTGEVAEILESKYHIYETFWMLKQADILEALSEAVKGELESLAMGKPFSSNPLASASTTIENYFKEALSQREFDGMIPGVPTKAALRGVSHRFKHPYARRGERPSFIDTGLYQSSFKVWID